jgi:geranylgeranyl transferase type-1 subunit beta
MSSPFDPPLDKPRHLRYWQRCVRTLLPHHYTPNDSQRLTLGFFIIAAIDLLSPLSTSTPNPEDNNNKTTTNTNNKPLLTPSDRRNLRAWVLSCQHPHGGFCGSPSHVFPHASHDPDAGGNPNIAATYFALLLLPMLTGEEEEEDREGAYAGVDRAKTLRWLRTLQRLDGDGSFGEVVYELPSFGGGGGGGGGTTTNSEPERKRFIVGGGKDMRYCYLAAAIRWILRGDVAATDEDYVEDIDVAALVRHIHRSQSYDGGFSESLGHESHAGYAYCAVAALALLDRPVSVNNDTDASSRSEARQQQQETQSAPATTTHYARGKILQEGIGDMPRFISFLVSRQFAYLEAKEEKKEQADDKDDDDEEDPESANFHMASLSLSEPHEEDTKHVGFNGRCNKLADTCYTWWVLGSLSILGVLDQQPISSSSSTTSSSPPKTTTTVDPQALAAARGFLLEKTQHAIGGFGKRPRDPPDIYHSSLGLFALATMGDPSLKNVDAVLAVSVDTVKKIEAGRKGLLRRARGRMNAEAGAGGEEGGGASSSGSGGPEFGKALVDMAISMGNSGERPAWLNVVV